MLDFSNYKMVRLIDVADVERAQKGKVYPAGSILIALSATKGQVEYVDLDSEIESRWAVAVPKTGCESKYLYYSILTEFPRFIHIHKTGINLQMDELKYLRIHIHPPEIQKKIEHYFSIIEQMEKKEEQEVERWKNIKKSYLEKMLLTNL